MGVLSGETTAGRTIAGDYVFEKRIRDELLLHPREYTHLSSEAFRKSMRLIPQILEQSIKTELNPATRQLVSNLDPIDRAKVETWIPAEEIAWAQQIRINAYVFDMILKMRRLVTDIDTKIEGFKKLEECAELAYLAALGAQRHKFLKKLELVYKAAGTPMVRDAETLHELQHRDVLDATEAEVLIDQSKKLKQFTQETTKKRKINGERVFGQGRHESGTVVPGYHSDRFRRGQFRGRGYRGHSNRTWSNPIPRADESTPSNPGANRGANRGARGRYRTHSYRGGRGTGNPTQ